MAPNPPFVTNEIPSAAKWNTLVGSYVKRTNEIDVVSTTTETDLLKDGSGTAVSVGAGHLSTDRMLRVTVDGDMLNNTGGTVSLTLRLKLGGTTLVTIAVSSVSASASRQRMTLSARVSARGATNSQRAWLEGIIANQSDFGQGAAGTVDTTAACNLELTAELGSSSANYSFRKQYAVVELL